MTMIAVLVSYPLCCMQLSSSKGPRFVQHIKPVPAKSDNQPKQTSSNKISRAGEDWGLQVFTDSVPEVTQVRRRAPRLQGP